MRQAPAASGAYVRDMDTGAELYALRENAVRIPASVEKLFTTSAALLRLGPSATLMTRAVDGAATRSSSPAGRCAATSCSSAAATRSSATHPPRGWREAIRAAGIRRIAGAIVGDESAFDDAPLGLLHAAMTPTSAAS